MDVLIVKFMMHVMVGIMIIMVSIMIIMVVIMIIIAVSIFPLGEQVVVLGTSRAHSKQAPPPPSKYITLSGGLLIFPRKI